MRYKFTDEELKKILKHLVIVVDTREQCNQHILKYFEQKKIPYKIQKLDYGDYGAYLPVGSFKGQMRDIYFTDDFVVERKANIDELANNFKDAKTNINELKPEIAEYFIKNYGEKYLQKILKCDYNRIKQELTSMNKYDIKFVIFLEDLKFDEHLERHKYISRYEPSTLKARLNGLESEFRTTIRPIDKLYIGREIYRRIYSEVRNILVHKGFIENMEELEKC